MEENNTQQNQNTAEEIKEVKNEPEKKVESQNTAPKKDYSEAKKFFPNMFKTPYNEMKKVVSKPKAFMVITLTAFITWVVIECIDAIVGVVKSFSYSYYPNLMSYITSSFSDMFSVIKALIIPAVIVALLSFIIYLLMQNKKKHYMTIVSTIIVAKIPVIAASILSLFSYIGSEVSKITASFSSFCYVISTVLVYFAIKALYGEEDDNKAIKTFFIAMAIFYAVALVLKFFNLYI